MGRGPLWVRAISRVSLKVRLADICLDISSASPSNAVPSCVPPCAAVRTDSRQRARGEQVMHQVYLARIRSNFLHDLSRLNLPRGANSSYGLGAKPMRCCC